MVEWHHQLNGHEFEQAPGDGEDREALSAAVHGVAELDMTETEQQSTESPPVIFPFSSE